VPPTSQSFVGSSARLWFSIFDSEIWSRNMPRRGRPKLYADAAAKRIAVMLPSALLSRVDDYAADELCGRSQAIKDLLERGLGRQEADEVQSV